jgi:hypothetical protein
MRDGGQATLEKTLDIDVTAVAYQSLASFSSETQTVQARYRIIAAAYKLNHTQLRATQ